MLRRFSAAFVPLPRFPPSPLAQTCRPRFGTAGPRVSPNPAGGNSRRERRGRLIREFDAVPSPEGMERPVGEGTPFLHGIPAVKCADGHAPDSIFLEKQPKILYAVDRRVCSRPMGPEAGSCLNARKEAVLCPVS